MRLLIVPLVALVLPLLACAADDDDDLDIIPGATVTVPAGSPTPANGTPPAGPLDRERILESLQEVRDLIARNVPNLDPQLIQDVDFDDDTLTVTVDEDRVRDATDDFESVCDDVSGAIGFTDLTVVIENSDGDKLAECSLS